MKELKKLTTFQDKVERGSKPKGYAEPWAVQVSLIVDPTNMIFLVYLANLLTKELSLLQV